MGWSDGWFGGRAVSTLARLGRIQAREPAVWCGCLAAALPFGWLAAGVAPERMWLVVPLAIACGGLAMTAAVGDPPLGLPDGRQRPWLPLWFVRAVWPCAGAVAAAALVGPFAAVDVRLACLTGGCVAVGGVAAFGSMLVARRAGLDPAPTASVGLFVVAAGAVAAAAAGLMRATPAGQMTTALAAGLAAWRLVVGLAGRYPADEAVAGFDNASSALRAIAMLTTLVAMAVCFFLAPQLAAGFSVVAIGWFVCLAVPIATAGGRNRAAAAIRRSTVGRPALPGSRGLATATAIDHATLLGWPAVVAVFLPPVGGPRAVPPWAALLVLAAAAAVLTVAGRVGRVGETTRSAMLTAAAGLAVGAAAWP